MRPPLLVLLLGLLLASRPPLAAAGGPPAASEACEACHAVTDQVLQRAHGPGLADVYDAAEDVCTPARLTAYNLIPPVMVRACQALFDAHDELLELIQAHRSQAYPEYALCHRTLGLCAGDYARPGYFDPLVGHRQLREAAERVEQGLDTADPQLQELLTPERRAAAVAAVADLRAWLADHAEVDAAALAAQNATLFAHTSQLQAGMASAEARTTLSSLCESIYQQVASVNHNNN